MRRRTFLATLVLVPAVASAQSPQTRSAPRPARTARREPQAMILPPPAPPEAPAPVPDRDLEAPRDPSANSAEPRFGPALIDPNTPRYGATSDPHSPQAREDRFLRQPGAGGRLTVPFSY